jgi:outer membrane lipase/esterase
MNKIVRPHAGRRSLMAAAALAAAMVTGAQAHASPYDTLVFFGDSLTNSGAYTSPTLTGKQFLVGNGANLVDTLNAAGPASARLAGMLTQTPVSAILYQWTGERMQPSYTTNPDPVWAAPLARGLGGDLARAWMPAADGGGNQAWGGARIADAVKLAFQADVPGLGSQEVYLMIPSVTDQVSTYLSHQPQLSSHGLYAVWIGANDLLSGLEAQAMALANPATQAAAADRLLGDAGHVAAQTAGQIRRLGAAGAGTVLVLGLPNIGSTPRALALGGDARQLLSFASLRFNESLNNELADYRGNLVMLDAYGLLDELVANPARYGLGNVTEPACKGSSGICVPASLVAPGANRDHLYADGVHPSGIGHELIADYVLSVLQAPSRIGLLAEAPLAGSRASLRAIEERLRNRDDAAAVQAYASYEHGNGSQRSADAWRPGLGNRMDMLALGVDGAVSRHWTLGAGLTHIRHDATLGEDGGGFRLEQTQVSAYARYRLHDWSAALIASAGYLDYPRISRDFSIGPTRLSERGDTQGTTSVLSALTHYDWHAGIYTVTPSAGLTLQNASVDGYTETRDGGRTATSMNYLEQRRRSLVSTLGLRLQADLRLGGYLWQPYGGLGWEHEFNHDSRSVTAHVSAMAGGFSQEIARGPADMMVTTAGLKISDGGAWSGQAGYQGRYGSGTSSQSLQAMVAYTF